MQTAAPDVLVGRSLEGRYRILEPVARGGMSTVYAAVDERLDRLVAVKVMSSALSADPAFNDRFAREARAAARLTHLNVVSVYDQGHESGPDGRHVFLVMELVEGRTLRELLRERGRLTPAEAVSLMEPVLSALSAAHRAGIVHRDIKPENILLSDEGVVKVADFGLARAVDVDAASTRTGLMMGTVAYCSPEQITEGRADQRSDVYAAGVVLFELLTGTPPYQGESAMNVAYQHVHSRVPAPSSRMRGGPPQIDRIVLGATDPDPARRPSDAGALLAQIADVRSELGLAVMPVPPRAHAGVARARASRPAPLPSRPVESVTTDLRGARSAPHDTAPVQQRRGPGGPGSGPPPPIVIPPRPPVSPRVRRRRRTLIGIVVVLLLAAGAGTAGWWFASGRYSDVPQVVGATVAQARAELEQAGYKVKIQPGPEFDSKIKKGLVLRTEPSAGSRLVRGDTVTIVLSQGPHYYSIPSVRGRTLDQAKETLGGIGPVTIRPEIKRESSDTVPKDRVTRTNPAAGSKVTADQPIQIYVSTGPPVVDVPTIAQGTPFEDARHTLRTSAGKFKVREVEEYNDSVPKGGVITVTPSDRARKFSTVTVTVSKGPEMVRVPTIGFLAPVADATRIITQAGLVPVVHSSPGATPTRVVNMSPAAGVLVKAGSKVDLYAI